MKLEVTGCDDCPCLDGNTYEVCQIPGMPQESMKWQSKPGLPHYITPDWCPLRTEPVTVELKKP